MKKFLLSMLSICMLFVLVGCNGSDVTLDLEKISNELDNLTTGEISLPGIYVEDLEVYGELNYVYDFDFKDTLGLDSELVKEYNVNYNKDTKELLAVFRPVEGKEEEIKTQMKTFAESVNAELKEEKGLLIYIASKDNEKVLQRVLDSEMPIFGSMMMVQKEELQALMELDPNSVEELLMKVPMMMTQSNTYIIVKPAAGKEKEVEKAIDGYMTRLEDQWSTYLPDQFELVENRTETKVGDYLVYIVSNNNDAVLNVITSQN